MAYNCRASDNMISAIIPILNEGKILDRSLSQLKPQLQRHELIIVDGGSTDDSLLIAKKYGQVISSPQGRARQMNAGAAAATGNILLFLHADVWLDSGAIRGVESAIAAGPPTSESGDPSGPGFG